MSAAFAPPIPAIPEHRLGRGEYLRTLRTNTIATWPREAYELPIRAATLLGRPSLLLNDPEAIHHVLVANPENYRRTAASIRLLRPVVGNGLLLAEGDAWRHQRRTLAPSFAPRVMSMLCRHVAVAAIGWLSGLVSRAADGPIDLLAEMQGLTLEIAGRALFSLETGAFRDEMRAMITEFGLTLARPYLLDLLLPLGLPSPRDLLRWRFKRRWMRLIDRILAARLAVSAGGAGPGGTETGGDARDLLDLMLAARDPESGEAFDRTALREQVATLIVAGHETTAVALFWSLFLLAAVPEEQERFAAEVAGLTSTPENAAAMLPRMPRTRAVVSEALRLYPPAATMVRQAIADDRIGATDIPRGTVVFIAPWVLHRHRRLWREPDRFDPSRFLPDAPPPPRFAYLPFGAGPRICIGAQFALAEAALVLAMLLQRFTLARETEEPVLPVSVVTTHPDHPPGFRLRARPAG